MRLKLISTIVALGLGMSAQAKDFKYTTVPGDMMQTRIYTLDNGLKVYLSVNAEKPRIQTYIAYVRVRRTTLQRLLDWLTIWST